MFKLLGASETGIDFANTIKESDSFNVQTDVYIYNGAGVAVGDIDNDGMPDVFFSGNMVSSRLYRNEGGMHFQDITLAAGVTTRRWATGATMVDINNDGYLDIYVSVSGPERTTAAERANLLFVNNGNRTFTEAAAQYGIADTGFTTHAVFLDYDRDGCLDLFVLNNSPKDFTRGVASHPMATRGTTPASYNELYHNDCALGKPTHYTNVSQKAGILRDAGYGLGVAIADLNQDGWPDIYVSNDGMPNDVMYINNRDGTFRDAAPHSVKHASQAGMGVDIADFDNDGRPDILQVDMLPGDLPGRKKTGGYNSLASVADAERRGFRTDYSQNSLQLSSGTTDNGDPLFSEISRMAGVANTGWSWSALFADFDNDGYKDIFIGNGYPKAVNDLDYMGALFAVNRSGDIRNARRLLNALPAYRLSNFVFRNNGDLTFQDKTAPWGMDQPGFSYGAAYADLNNDGRLDLVVSNINGPAFVYENVAPLDDSHHYLEIRLDGEAGRQNSAGIGAQVTVKSGGRKQYFYSSPYRGFMSTVDARVHVGLGAAARVDSLVISWPDGRMQVLTNVAADRLVVLREADATDRSAVTDALSAAMHPLQDQRWFQRIDARGLKYIQQASSGLDFTVQPLLPYQLSAHGPPFATADVNADGLDDVFIGGGAGVPGRLFLQQRDGSFVEAIRNEPWAADKNYEDWAAAFVDVNGDGRPDLYVASGGYLQAPNSPLLQDRLYINEGVARFRRDTAALPPMLTSKGAVRAGDFNGDGRPDLFVSGRLTPRKYPYPTRSYILRNDAGHFTDVTAQLAPELVQPGGMITDAAWVDFNGDGRLDLVTAGEWMAIRFFRNDGSRFTDVTSSTRLPPLRGWWFSLAVSDIDKDGKPDLIAGNLGLNYTYTTSPDSRFGVYAESFTGNQTTDIVLTKEIAGIEYPFAGLAQLGQAIYPIGIRFPTHGSFATAPLTEAFSSGQLGRALHYEADTFSSIYLHNDGNGTFSVVALPNAAQISPIKAILPYDLDQDGNPDLIIAGNLYNTDPNIPRADAGNGLWLRGNGKGEFAAVSPVESGFVAPLDVSGLALVKGIAGTDLVVANSGDSVQVYKLKRR